MKHQYYPPGVLHRGKVDGTEPIHLRIVQRRPGLVEGKDYHMDVKCHNGSFHIRYTNDPSKVTCPKCKP